MDCLEKVPPEEIFILPVRIEECEPKDKKLKSLQFADIFCSYEQGFIDILKTIKNKFPEIDNRKIIRFNEIIYHKIKYIEYEDYELVAFQHVAPFDKANFYSCPKCGETSYHLNEKIEPYAEQSLLACISCGCWVYAWADENKKHYDPIFVPQEHK